MMKESGTSVDAGRLMTLAEKANKAHRHAQSAARRRVKHGLEAGRLLLEAKETVGHGNFTEWIEKNFEGTPRHARRYMTFATAVEQNRIDPDECDQRDIDYSQHEMGFRLTDVTHLLPEALCPILVSERLNSELHASGDYRGQVWDLFFMGAQSPERVRQTYNVYFSLVLNGREQTACVTQCGGSYTENYFVFALAGENIYYEVDVRNPEVRALAEGISREAPLPSTSLETRSLFNLRSTT